MVCKHVFFKGSVINRRGTVGDVIQIPRRTGIGAIEGANAEQNDSYTLQSRLDSRI